MTTQADLFADFLELIAGLDKLDTMRGEQIAELQQQVGSIVLGMQAITEAYALRTELDDLRLEIRDLTPRGASVNTYDVTVTYVTTVEVDDEHDDEYDVKQAVLDEIDSNENLYMWDIVKQETPDAA